MSLSTSELEELLLEVDDFIENLIVEDKDTVPSINPDNPESVDQAGPPNDITSAVIESIPTTNADESDSSNHSDPPSSDEEYVPPQKRASEKFLAFFKPKKGRRTDHKDKDTVPSINPDNPESVDQAGPPNDITSAVIESIPTTNADESDSSNHSGPPSSDEEYVPPQKRASEKFLAFFKPKKGRRTDHKANDTVPSINPDNPERVDRAGPSNDIASSNVEHIPSKSKTSDKFLEFFKRKKARRTDHKTDEIVHSISTDDVVIVNEGGSAIADNFRNDNSPKKTLATEDLNRKTNQCGVEHLSNMEKLPNRETTKKNVKEPSGNQKEKTKDPSNNKKVTDTSSKHAKKRKKKAPQLKLFKNSWLNIKVFKGWLQKGLSKSNKGGDMAHCKLCNENMIAQKSVIMMHSQKAEHQKRATEDGKQRNISKDFQLTSKMLETRRIELRLCAMLAVQNLPFLHLDVFTPFIAETIRDSETIQEISLRRTKAQALTTNVLGKHFLEVLIRKLCDTHFSVILDETTDCAHRKQCGFTVIFFDKEKDSPTESFLDLVDQSAGKAIDLYNCLKKTITTKGIPWKNLVGFSADTTNVMVGEILSVFALLKRDNPFIVTIKCSCHSIHMSASWACKCLPKCIEDLLRNVGGHFHRSALRIDKFRPFQVFFSIDIHMMLSPGQTRWLSLKAACDRVIEQYPALVGYFTEECKSDPSHTNEQILSTLKYPFTMPYLEFMSYVLELLNDFNILFQSDHSMLHRLRGELNTLMKHICKNFLEFNYSKQTKFLDINSRDQSNHLPLTSLYLGPAAHHSIEELQGRHDISEKSMSQFYETIQNFYMELVDQIQKRFDFVYKDDLFDLYDILQPAAAQDYKTKSLSSFFKRLPSLKDSVDETKADEEWAAHALLDHKELNLDRGKNYDAYWQDVFKLKNSKDEILYPNLKEIVNFLAILPFSNASVERFFSTLKEIKSDKRNKLHSATIAASVRIKEGVGGPKGVIHWEPSENLLKSNHYYKNTAENEAETDAAEGCTAKISPEVNASSNDQQIPAVMDDEQIQAIVNEQINDQVNSQVTAILNTPKVQALISAQVKAQVNVRVKSILSTQGNAENAS